MAELLGKSKSELRAFCAALREPAYRGGQIYHALYAERKFDVARIRVAGKPSGTLVGHFPEARLSCVRTQTIISFEPAETV